MCQCRNPGQKKKNKTQLYIPARKNQNEVNHLALVSQKYTPTFSLAVLPHRATLRDLVTCFPVTDYAEI